MRVKRIVLGMAAVASAAVIAACSSGTAAQPASDAHLATGPTTTTAAAITTTTTNPTTTTPPATTTQPPATHHATTQAAPETQADAPAYAPGIPCHLVTGACADLSAHKVWIVQDGKVVFGPVSIMPGTKSYPTPTGTFHVLSKVVNYHSREFDNALMKYSVFFYPGDAFHVGSLGVPSHGCIHMTYSSAQSFFSQMSVGEEVQIVA